MIRDQGIDDGSGLHVRWMPVVRLQRIRALEVADEHEVDCAPAAIEAAADLYGQQSRNAAELPLERLAYLREIVRALEPPQHDMSDHRA